MIKLNVTSPLFLYTPRMSRMNNTSTTPQKKSSIPSLSKDQLASTWATRAEDLGATQLFRADGSPIIGALVYSTPAMTQTKAPKSKQGNHCKLDCCSEKRPLVSSFHALAPRISQFPDYSNLEPEFTGWVTVEKRSVRRLKTSARFQKDKQNETNYVRPSVLYAMED